MNRKEQLLNIYSGVFGPFKLKVVDLIAKLNPGTARVPKTVPSTCKRALRTSFCIEKTGVTTAVGRNCSACGYEFNGLAWKRLDPKLKSTSFLFRVDFLRFLCGKEIIYFVYGVNGEDLSSFFFWSYDIRNPPSVLE